MAGWPLEAKPVLTTTPPGLLFRAALRRLGPQTEHPLRQWLFTGRYPKRLPGARIGGGGVLCIAACVRETNAEMRLKTQRDTFAID